MRDVDGFLLDGALSEVTHGLLWVSDDAELLEAHLARLARRILEGDVPPEWVDRRLLRFEIDALVRGLASDEPETIATSLFDEAERAGAALAFPSLDRLLDAPGGREFLDALRERLAQGDIAHCIVLADHAGLRRLLTEAPRLTAFFGVRDVDRDTTFSPTAVTLPTDSSDLGWILAVQCRLTAPAPALDGLKYGVRSAAPGAGEALAAAGVERLWTVSGSAGPTTLFVALRPDAADCDAIDEAERIGLAAARRVVGRPLTEDEALEVTRMVCYVSGDR